MVTPLIIGMALHYHCRSQDYGDRCGDNNYGARAVQDAFDWFVSEGLLERRELDEPRYIATEKLHLWVDAICKTPMPIQRWTIPAREPEVCPQ